MGEPAFPFHSLRIVPVHRCHYFLAGVVPAKHDPVFSIQVLAGRLSPIFRFLKIPGRQYIFSFDLAGFTSRASIGCPNRCPQFIFRIVIHRIQPVFISNVPTGRPAFRIYFMQFPGRQCRFSPIFCTFSP